MKNKNVERFFNGTISYFRLIGFEYDTKGKRINPFLILGFFNSAVVIIGQILFNIFEESDLQTRTENISYLSYFLVSTAKLTSLIYYRKNINEIFNEFRQIYPSEEYEKAFHLQKYLNQSLMIEKVLAGFYKITTLAYIWSTFLLSIVNLARSGIFNYKLPLMWSFLIDISTNNIFIYAVSYLTQAHACSVSATTILSVDLCLFSSILQTCMHFDVINKNILLIEPHNEPTAKLKEQIAYHQRILRLAEKLNDVFTPSVLFSLLSSSLIICFTGFQLLGDLSIFTIFRALCLLAYELKQVAITCYLGDKLIDISLQVSEAIYEHKWYEGTPKYRRYVLMVLLRSQQSVALNIAGISDISLQTFRQVMSISYQIFTLLKTG